MTPQEFAAKIRAKYPDGVAADGRNYASISDEELSQKIIAKYPAYASQVTFEKEPINKATKLAATVDSVFGSGKVGEAIGTQVVKGKVLRGEIGAVEPDFESLTGEQISRLKEKGLPTSVKEQRERVASQIKGPTAKQIAGSVLKSASLFTPIGKLASGITAGARAVGIARGASALGKIGAGALAGEAFDVAQNLQEDKTGAAIFKPSTGAAIGATIPAVGVALNVAGRVAKSVAPKLLSYTSDVPEKSFEIMLQRRGNVVQALKKGVTGEQALSNTQGAVRQLRTTLSAEWDDATKGIYEEFSGKRWGMGDKAIRLAEKVADDFGIELPQNIKKMSVKESLDLLKEVNELYSKRAVKESAQGISVRKFKDFLQTATIKNFGGESGSVAQLYKNYSAKKGILDAANDIVKAYSTGKPIQQSTALGRLKALFNENKSAYLDAILDLEKTTGRDLLSEITAVQFQGKLPGKLASVSSSGGLQAPKGFLDKAISLLLLPLSSPRSAGFIARYLSQIKSPNIPSEISPGDVLLKKILKK